MVSQYLILVDKRDSEKFRMFKIGKFNTTTQEFLNKNGLKFIWGFHNGQKLDSWTNIQKDDSVFFSIPKNNFEITAKVAKKIIRKNLGKTLWPYNLDSQNITHFLLFDNIGKTNLLFTKTLDFAIKQIKMPFAGIYKLKKNFRLSDTHGSTTSQTNNKSDIKSIIIPFEKRKLSPRETFEVQRFLRDSNKVKKLKKLYDNKCQICQHTFEYNAGKFYSEVHHYNPLKASANDELDNMIVVCPNHHAKFDYNVIAIALDGTSIINTQGKKIGTIHFKNNHSISIQNIKSQIREN